MTKPNKTKVTKIRSLGIGSIFAITKDSHTENWKIIGRPGESGTTPDQKKVYTVKAIFVSADQNYSPDKEAKYFDINTEVTEVRKASKDFDAIDRRDQPDEVTSIADLMRKQAGGDLEEESNIEEMLDEEETETETEEEAPEEAPKRGPGRPRKEA